jgi:2-dehydropantoate 2-reductase
LSNADLLLVTVKAWQVSGALEPLLSKLHPDLIVLAMHNGMGTFDYLVDNLPNNPLLFATTSHGALKMNDSDVKHTGWGETKLGALNQKGLSCQFLTDVLNHALAPVEWQENIHHALLLKLAVNCAINPLTALNNIKNGQLSTDSYSPLLEKLIDEICCVINAEGLTITREALTTVVNKVIISTADNYSSMHQDIAHQRRTEIDFITGYLLERAKCHNISVPINDSLFQKIKKIEDK